MQIYDKKYVKKIKTISIVSCLILSSPMVQASKLDIYALAHLSIDSINDGIDSSLYIASSSSRLGIKGEHSLKNTYTVFYQFETGLDPTGQGINDGNGTANSTNEIFTVGRPSFIGIRGKFGKLLMGHTAFLDQWANEYNLFVDQVGDIGNLWEDGLPGRTNNVVQYHSPYFGDVDFGITFEPEEGAKDKEKLLLKGNYVSSNLKIGVAFASVAKGTALSKQTAQVVSLAYDLGRYTVGGGVQNESDVGGAAGQDRLSYSFGGSVKFGIRSVLKAQIVTSHRTGANNDANQIAFGYDYNADSSTTFYVALASVNNEANVNFSANGKGHGDKVTPALGKDPSAISLGMVYRFDVALVK